MPMSRSWMFIPGDQPDKLEKIDRTEADNVICDLEDAVSLPAKKAARNYIQQALANKRTKKTYVRVNDCSSPEWMEDVRVAAIAGADGIVLPKAGNAGHIAIADAMLRHYEASAGREPGCMRIVPLIESAAGLHRALEIAGASPRVQCLAFGSMDYSLDIRARLTKEGHELLFARSMLVHVSRVAGIEAPIDGVFLDFHDDAGLRQEALSIRQLGFQGKLTIHPKQNRIVNEAFSPNESEIREAALLVQAYDHAVKQGLGVIQYEGRMIDYPVAEQARQIAEWANNREGLR